MRREQALQLHSGDTVTVKKTSAIIRVVEVYEPTYNTKVVEIMLSDDCWYNHTEIK